MLRSGVVLRFSLFVMLGLTAASMCVTAHADDILTIVWGQYSSGAYTHLRATLQNAGHTVTQLGPPTAGQIATTIAANDFDQIYLFDVTTSRYLTNTNDLNALRDWYRENANGNIIIDSRAYALAYTGRTQDRQFVHNISLAFSAHGGGLWIGCDHASTFCQNANALLSHLNYVQCAGAYSTGLTACASSSEIFNTPYSLTYSDLNWGASASNVPSGLQPDGVTLTPLAWVNSSVRYVSGSIGLLYTPVPTATPTPAPVPATGPIGGWILIILLSLLLPGVRLFNRG